LSNNIKRDKTTPANGKLHVEGHTLGGDR